MISEHSSRREALKSILAVTGGLAAAAFLPARWVKPVVNTGTIPAHAQASAVQVGKITIYHDEPQTDGVTYFTVPAFQVFAQTPGFSFHNGGHARLASPVKDPASPANGASITLSLDTCILATPTNPSSYPVTRKTGADGYADFGNLHFDIENAYNILVIASCGAFDDSDNWFQP